VEINGSAATGNQVQGNFIGTDMTGSAALGNDAIGVVITNAANNNTIGGTIAAARNVISANNVGGVNIQGAGATGNKVIGNYIGTDFNGTAVLGNLGTGVGISASASNTIGGTAAGERNLISGNGTGVSINSGATSNKVSGNYIGTDVTGLLDLGNSAEGVVINFALNNIIGGTTAGERNLISGNGNGVLFNSATGNLVIGNFIGTDVNGIANIGNSNNFGGIIILDGSNNIIGGTTAAESNLISGNMVGVKIFFGRARRVTRCLAIQSSTTHNSVLICLLMG
jgi:titin